VDGMKISATPSPGHRSVARDRSENSPAFRRAYRDDGCGPCGLVLVSGVSAFSPGAGSNGAPVRLFPFGRKRLTKQCTCQQKKDRKRLTKQCTCQQKKDQHGLVLYCCSKQLRM